MENSGPAAPPQTKYFYTMGVNEAHDFVLSHPLPDIYKPGTPIAGQYSGGGMATNLKVFAPSGTFSAINTTSGAIDWQYKSDRPMYGGALATASVPELRVVNRARLRPWANNYAFAFQC